MKRTYIDTGVLIAAAIGSGKIHEKAMAIITDCESREFVCSDYVKLELIPKPTYFDRKPELAFYEAFFATVSTWLPFQLEHLEKAFREACSSGLGALDALHIVAAAGSGCDEIVTTEKATKAIHRSSLLPIISIDIE